MKLRNVTIVAAALAVALPTVATAADKVTIKYLTAWDNRVQGTPKIAYRFGDMVKKATNGRIEFKFSGPEVIKSRQQFQPTSRGVFDMNLSVAPYYVGTTGSTWLPSRCMRIPKTGAKRATGIISTRK